MLYVGVHWCVCLCGSGGGHHLAVDVLGGRGAGGLAVSYVFVESQANGIQEFFLCWMEEKA